MYIAYPPSPEGAIKTGLCNPIHKGAKTIILTILTCNSTESETQVSMQEMLMNAHFVDYNKVTNRFEGINTFSSH